MHEQLDERADHLRGQVVDAEIALVLEHRHRGGFARAGEPGDDHQVGERRRLAGRRNRLSVELFHARYLHARKLDGTSGRARNVILAALAVWHDELVRWRRAQTTMLAALTLLLLGAGPVARGRRDQVRQRLCPGGGAARSRHARHRVRHGRRRSRRPDAAGRLSRALARVQRARGLHGRRSHRAGSRVRPAAAQPAAGTR